MSVNGKAAAVLALLLWAGGCKPPAATPAVSPTATAATSPNASDAKPGESETEFAKNTFTRLANGDTSVANNIDWESLQAISKDVGALYRPFNDEAARAAFRTSFITSFSKSFKGTGASAESLTNWKVASKDATTTTVSAETIKHTHFLLILSKSTGSMKLTGMQAAP